MGTEYVLIFAFFLIFVLSHYFVKRWKTNRLQKKRRNIKSKSVLICPNSAFHDPIIDCAYKELGFCWVISQTEDKKVFEVECAACLHVRTSSPIEIIPETNPIYHEIIQRWNECNHEKELYNDFSYCPVCRICKQ